jgi:protein TonB
MIITRLHLIVTVLIALTLHGGLAMWLTLPSPAPFPKPPVQTLRINLLAAIAETTVSPPATVPILPPKPVSKPVMQSAPTPSPKSKPVPEPELREIPPEPKLPVNLNFKPAVTKPPPVKTTPEPVEMPKPVSEIIPPAPTKLPMKSSTTPADVIATAQYEQLLVAWLEKHKKYPRRAKRLRIEGEGKLRILIDRTGRLQNVTLEQPTGNRLLDRATLEMAHRAAPFPPMPESDSRGKLEFIVPVAFVLH